LGFVVFVRFAFFANYPQDSCMPAYTAALIQRRDFNIFTQNSPMVLKSEHSHGLSEIGVQAILG